MSPASGILAPGEHGEQYVAAVAEAELLVQPDGAGVRGDGVQERSVAAGGDAGRDRRVSRPARPCPRQAGSVQTALISVQPGGRSRSPAIATSSPSRLMPR